MPSVRLDRLLNFVKRPAQPLGIGLTMPLPVIRGIELELPASDVMRPPSLELGDDATLTGAGTTYLPVGDRSDAVAAEGFSSLGGGTEMADEFVDVHLSSQTTRSWSETQHLRGVLLHYGGEVLRYDREYKDLASRVGHVIDTMKWNKTKLAEEVGAGQSAVGNWIHRNSAMEARYAFILQDKYRWNARWLLEGVLPRRIDVTDEEAERLFLQILSLPEERRKALEVFLRPD